MSTGDMKKYGAILGAGILGIFILVLALKVVGRRSMKNKVPQTIELPDENEQSSVVTEDVDDLDEFDDLFNDLDEEEDDLDSFLDDFE